MMILAYFIFNLKISSSWNRCFKGNNYLGIAQALGHSDSADSPKTPKTAIYWQSQFPRTAVLGVRLFKI